MRLGELAFQLVHPRAHVLGVHGQLLRLRGGRLQLGLQLDGATAGALELRLRGRQVLAKRIDLCLWRRCICLSGGQRRLDLGHTTGSRLALGRKLSLRGGEPLCDGLALGHRNVTFRNGRVTRRNNLVTLGRDRVTFHHDRVTRGNNLVALGRDRVTFSGNLRSGALALRGPRGPLAKLRELALGGG